MKGRQLAADEGAFGYGGHGSTYSDEMAQRIDSEIRALLERNWEEGQFLSGASTVTQRLANVTLNDAARAQTQRKIDRLTVDIQRFNEEAAINIISSTLHDQAGSVHYNFNPLDKLIEAYEENKKLYERLIQAEKDKVDYLEQLMKSKS